MTCYSMTYPIFGRPLMWQHIQPLRQTIVPVFLIAINFDLTQPWQNSIVNFFAIFIILFTLFVCFGDQLFSNFFFLALTASSTTLACGLLNPNSSARRSSSFKRPNSLQQWHQQHISCFDETKAACTHRPVMPCSTKVSIAAFESPASRKNSETSDVVISCNFLFTQVEAGSELCDASSSPNLAAMVPS